MTVLASISWPDASNLIDRTNSRAQRLSAGGGGLSFSLSFCFVGAVNVLHLSFYLSFVSGDEGSGWEFRHLAGSPGGGGVIRLCHTLVRVNTV